MTPEVILSITSIGASVAFLIAAAVIVVMTAKLREAKLLEQKVQHEQRKNEQLRQSMAEAASKNTFYDYLLNHLPIPVWTRDEDLNIELYNDAYLKLLGMDPNTPITDQHNLEIGQGSLMLAELVKRSEKAQSARKHIIINNQRKPYYFHEHNFEFNKGTIGYAEYVEELEHTEKELKQYTAMLSDLLESSASAMAIYNSDKQLKFFNQAFVHLWRLDQNWLDTEPSYGEILEVLREKQKLPEQSNFVEFKATNLGYFTNLIEKHEEFYYLPDGKVLRMIVIPHALGGMLFSYEDMTDKITLEQSVHTLTSVKKSTIDSLFEGLAVYGEDGRLQMSNPAFADMWSLSASMLSSEPHFFEVMDTTKKFYAPENSWEEYKNEMFSIIHDQQEHNFRLELKDNRIIECAAMPLPDGAKLVTYRDISDSVMVERSLESEKRVLKEISEVKTKFLANMSYELRSPLTSIKGFSEMLLGYLNKGMNEKQTEYIADINKASLKLTELIDQIIDVVSIDAGHLTPDVEQIDFNEIVEQVMDDISELARQKKIILETQMLHKATNVWCDRNRLIQALNNIILHVIKLAPEHSRLLIESETVKNKIEFKVHVTVSGSNQAEAVIPSIDYKTDVKLSLPIAQSIIELHGGKLDAHNMDDGFEITCTIPKKYQKLVRLHSSEAA